MIYSEFILRVLVENPKRTACSRKSKCGIWGDV